MKYEARLALGTDIRSPPTTIASAMVAAMPLPIITGRRLCVISHAFTLESRQALYEQEEKGGTFKYL